MQKHKHRMAGTVEERYCTKCGKDGIYYILIEHKWQNVTRPMVRFEAICQECGYNWVETFEMVPNSHWNYD